MTFWRINSYFGAHVELEIEAAISSVAGFTLIWICQLFVHRNPNVVLQTMSWQEPVSVTKLRSGGGVDSGYEATLSVSIKIW